MNKSRLSAEKSTFWHGRYIVSLLHAHIAFVTKYRRGAIIDSVRETIH